MDAIFPNIGIPESFTTSQTQLLHLKPAPRLTISILSPFFNLFLASMYPRTYHSPPADVSPHRCNDILVGSKSYSLSPRLAPTPSITARPPGCRQKCSIPVFMLTTPVIARIGHFLLPCVFTCCFDLFAIVPAAVFEFFGAPIQLAVRKCAERFPLFQEYITITAKHAERSEDSMIGAMGDAGVLLAGYGIYKVIDYRHEKEFLKRSAERERRMECLKAGWTSE
ncbi:unnamed protein product [Cuscuta campestris]|uniref:Uncharacterized protein n=1 Tax=Cuscuta campestris TaxID=132261 RepID=A0A484M926_9ASTE|nr:unnamed protein product [Cuscuta campestris]